MTENNLTFRIDDLKTKAETEEFPGGTLEGLASTFGNVDLQGDVILPGAFKKTVERFDRGQLKIPLLDNHRLFDTAAAAIGKIIELKETSRGLFFKAFFSTDASAQGIRTRVKEGILDSLSIGFTVPKKGGSRLRKDGVRELLEIFVREISVVCFPANTLAMVAAAKQKGVGLLIDEMKRAIRIRREFTRDHAKLRSLKSAATKLDNRLTRFQRRLA